MKLLLLDLDGTLREPASRENFPQHPKDFICIPGASEALNNYLRNGYIAVGITNQGGVAAGYKSLKDCFVEQEFTFSLFPQLESILFCPDFEGQQCYRCYCGEQTFDVSSKYPDLLGTYRKPNPGMLNIAINSNEADLNDCLMVGDRPEDEGAANAAGIKFIWADTWRGESA